jgi:transposase
MYISLIVRVEKFTFMEVHYGLVSEKDKWQLSDSLWNEIKPLLPPRKPHPLGCHNPRVPDKNAMEAILFVLRTGCQWNSLDASGICSSAYRRFREWLAAGVFKKFWDQELIKYDELRGIEWSFCSMDGAIQRPLLEANLQDSILQTEPNLAQSVVF